MREKNNIEPMVRNYGLEIINLYERQSFSEVSLHLVVLLSQAHII